MLGDEIPKQYEPHEVEKHWYKFWEENNLFRADVDQVKKTFSIVIPPPNVTGELHMGHALNSILQDSLCRFKKMNGYSVLWLPGTDHAGIATQNVVERQLVSEGTSRHELGREKFVERVWDWRSKYGDRIINQLKRLGASCDWSRERFTMDEGLSLAVKQVFVRLYKEGFIYRGDYIVNWCPRCHTAISDLEVEHNEENGSLYHINYPFLNGAGHITVATTRPETMLGDTAVAVHPKDQRYKGKIGKMLMLPLVNREIPVIADSYVDRSFGTGALKVTPAHDLNDFELGRRHNLENIIIMDSNACMTDEAGQYTGLDRFECRKKVVADLKKQGFLKKISELNHGVGYCYRCQTVVEPMLSKQWFVAVSLLADEAVNAVKGGKTRIIPKMWEKTYFEWMGNIRDWCISRQIWWGHRIPAWYCSSCTNIIVETEAPSSCNQCGGVSFVQETDVLDTWFSSSLWPFSTMGWPEETPELKLYYPTSVLITGFDILFFWVSRMLMMGVHFMDEVPFKDVYIHALVRDSEGQKMSKSKGNVIDPLSIIDKFGTDAFRFTLMAFAAQGRDIRFSEERIAGYRNFVNKLWNAARFTIMNMDKNICGDIKGIDKSELEHRFILTRLQQVNQEVIDAIESYRFNDVAQALYQFTWHEFCDWYLEMIKPFLYGNDERVKNRALNVLHFILESLVKMLHPVMPFITEEIYHLLPGTSGSIMKSVWPVFNEKLIFPDALSEMGVVMNIITAIRNIRGEMNVLPAVKISVICRCADESFAGIVNRNENILKSLARLSSLEWGVEMKKPQQCAAGVIDGMEIFIPLSGVIDVKTETKRLTKELIKLAKEISITKTKLENEDFIEKAPARVVENERNKLIAFTDKMQKFDKNLKQLREM